jgi:uroporphyrinogen-III synthase
MRDKVIAILESRVGEQMAELVGKYHGIPFSAPALAEIPDIDVPLIAKLMKRWNIYPPHIFIFQTGVGAKALFAAAKLLGLTGTLLEKLKNAQVVVRGPKPMAVLRSHGVRIDSIAKEPFTTTEVLNELKMKSLSGKRIVIQRYGESNIELQAILKKKGARVTEIATYRWGLPVNIEPLVRLINAIKRNEIDVIAFTSASQVNNLFVLAKLTGEHHLLQKHLNHATIASIGPVCTAALKKAGLKIDIEAKPPKLVPFVIAINDFICKQRLNS